VLFSRHTLDPHMFLLYHLRDVILVEWCLIGVMSTTYILQHVIVCWVTTHLFVQSFLGVLIGAAGVCTLSPNWRAGADAPLERTTGVPVGAYLGHRWRCS
jgi:hypothetical protein